MADEPEIEEEPPTEDNIEPGAAPVEPRETEADQQRGGKAPVPPAHSEPEAPTAGLEEMRRQLREAEARATQVEQAARRLQGERDQAIAMAQEAEKRGISTQELMIEDQIKATTSQLDTLTEQQAAAWSDGDFAKASQITRKMQELVVSNGFLGEKKLWLAQQRERQQREPQRQQATAPTDDVTAADPFEARIKDKYSPGATAFLRKHKDLVRSDGSLKRAAIDAHEAALDAGFTLDTQGYYDHIEKLLAGEGATNGAGEAAATAPPSPRNVAAPVSRGNVRVPGGGGKPQPTPTMRRLAAEQNVPIDDWMAHYTRLLSQGKIAPVR